MPPYFPARLCLSRVPARRERTDCRPCDEQRRYPRCCTGAAYQHQRCCSQFKKLAPRCITALPLDNLRIQLICEVDEMWSFIGNKKQQRWLWYAWEPRLKRIIAHVFGSRSRKTLRKLLGLLSGFSVAFWCTDNFSVYELLPGKKHITGKLYTQRIERENLNLRNRLKRLNRKTLGYSKSAEMHDKIIGTFIEREHYLQ